MKTQPIIDEKLKPEVHNYHNPTTHILQCKCGLMVQTRSVEYHCPLCNTGLVVPNDSTGSRKTAHRTYNWFKHYQSLKDIQYQIELTEVNDA